MTTPTEPSRWSVVVNRISPWYRLWRTQRNRTSQLLKLLTDAEHDLAVLRAKLADAQALLALKTDQAERAMTLASGGTWSADDIAFCADNEIDVER